jgi:mRNA-degrading endonuclease YafQ of YafQ-DinJ toxin-antitoxin module
VPRTSARRIEYSRGFVRSYRRLPNLTKGKFGKQIRLLVVNPSYPSLRVKKMAGFPDLWEARIDRFYRFTFYFENGVIRLLGIGSHDEGLGKK